MVLRKYILFFRSWRMDQSWLLEWTFLSRLWLWSSIYLIFSAIFPTKSHLHFFRRHDSYLPAGVHYRMAYGKDFSCKVVGLFQQEIPYPRQSLSAELHLIWFALSFFMLRFTAFYIQFIIELQ